MSPSTSALGWDPRGLWPPRSLERPGAPKELQIPIGLKPLGHGQWHFLVENSQIWVQIPDLS